MVKDAEKRDPRKWKSLDYSMGRSGFRVCEAPGQFKKERMAEHVLRIVGVMSILAANINLFAPEIFGMSAVALQARFALTVALAGVGVALYFFAVRGFQRAVQLDVKRRKVVLARLNSNDNSLFQQEFAVDEIESLFVKRGDGAEKGVLCLRLRGRNAPVTALKGKKSELSSLHRLVAETVQENRCPKPRRVNTPALAQKRRELLAAAAPKMSKEPRLFGAARSTASASPFA